MGTTKEKQMPDLTEENAQYVSTVVCKEHPEWGTKKFNYKGQPLNEGDYAHTVGSGSNSSVLFKEEMKRWAVASFKNIEPKYFTFGQLYYKVCDDMPQYCVKVSTGIFPSIEVSLTRVAIQPVGETTIQATSEHDFMVAYRKVSETLKVLANRPKLKNPEYANL